MNIIKVGILIIMMGFVLIFIGAISSGAEFGGIVMIGPIPLIFGTSPRMTVISILLAIVLIILYSLLWRRSG